MKITKYVSSCPTSHFFLTDAAASWRGSRDPAQDIAKTSDQKREFNQKRIGEKRDEFSGMGGMKRTR